MLCRISAQFGVKTDYIFIEKLINGSYTFRFNDGFQYSHMLNFTGFHSGISHMVVIIKHFNINQ